MVTHERWVRSYRAVASKYPTVSVYDRIADAANFAALLEIEALTNPRVREEAGAYRKVRPEDVVTGPGTTPIMASFAYSGPSRFCDGTYGVYYAGCEEATAVAESRYHTEAFLRATHQPSIDVDKRLYTATIEGAFDDVRGRSMRSKLYAAAPDDYGFAQRYAHRLYDRNRVDGIVYNSVRNPGGQCVAAFRPRIVSNARIRKYIQFRWDGRRITGVVDLVNLRE
ncbi:MAG TPA: RES family NAD+ phosphorylase [Candidatus Lustribacter sp.]